jgi:hypothetical protein
LIEPHQLADGGRLRPAEQHLTGLGIEGGDDAGGGVGAQTAAGKWLDVAARLVGGRDGRLAVDRHFIEIAEGDARVRQGVGARGGDRRALGLIVRIGALHPVAAALGAEVEAVQQPAQAAGAPQAKPGQRLQQTGGGPAAPLQAERAWVAPDGVEQLRPGGRGRGGVRGKRRARARAPHGSRARRGPRPGSGRARRRPYPAPVVARGRGGPPPPPTSHRRSSRAQRRVRADTPSAHGPGAGPRPSVAPPSGSVAASRPPVLGSDAHSTGLIQQGASARPAPAG